MSLGFWNRFGFTESAMGPNVFEKIQNRARLGPHRRKMRRAPIGRNSMQILVLGATGNTGKVVVEEALKRGFQVCAIARDRSKLQGLAAKVTEGTPYDDATVEKAIEGCDAVVNTLNVSRKGGGFWAPLTAPKDLISKSAENALAAMKKRGIRRFVTVGVYGANETWKKLPLIFRLIVSSSNLKHAFLDHGRQEELLLASGTDFTVCRAPFLTDEPGRTAEATPREKLPASRALSRRAAAKFFLDILESGKHAGEIVNLADHPATR